MPSAAKLLPIETAAERGTARVRVQLDLAGDIRVHDISTTGLLIEADAALAVGDTIEIDLPGAGRMAAEIVWSSGRFFGGRFDRSLSSAALRAASAESPVVWPHFPGAPQGGADRRSSAGRKLIEAQRPHIHEAKLTYGERMRIIIGGSALLWTAAAGLIFVTVA